MLALRTEQDSVEPSPKIRITWTELNEVGQAVFDFSQELTPLEDLATPLTVEEISNENFLVVNFTINSEVPDGKRPEVLSWKVSSFE